MTDNKKCEDKTPQDKLRSMYEAWSGDRNCGMRALPQGGSDRRYFRLTSPGKSAVGAIGENLKENEAFIRLTEYFHKSGIPVPELYATSDDLKEYLMEDLGDRSLFSMLGDAEAPAIIKECMISLARMQTLPRSGWENLTFVAPFGERQVRWDLNYFKYEYLKPSGIVFDENELEDDFAALLEKISSRCPELEGFMFRDCQSRNVMVKDGRPYWIDYQGGMAGPCLYDAVSFLWQAKAGFSPEFRREMTDVYAGELGRIRGVKKEDILADVGAYALLRTLQVLGAYGFRGLVQHRAHFIESIPGALLNLRYLIEVGELADYPELERVCKLLTEDSRFSPEKKDGLTVEVLSFSYKKGYPDNFTGNGGGFMFDCRGMHNPGRYPEFRDKTGRDREVRDFLEERGEVQPYLEGAWRVVDMTVETYLRRGFSSLQIGFGCTGGQHRSVYCAEATARHIAEKYPDARVMLVHREQMIKEEVKA